MRGIGFLHAVDLFYSTKMTGFFIQHKDTVQLPAIRVSCSKAVNTNPGLKVNRSIDFSSIKMFLTAYFLCSFRLLLLTT